MRWQIVRLKRKKRGFVSRRSRRVETDMLRLGRAADCEVHLADPRVRLRAAELHRTPEGDLMMVALTPGGLLVDDEAAERCVVEVGDKVGVGPYEVAVLSAPPGIDVALSYELTQPLGDDLQALLDRSSLRLSETRLSKPGLAVAGTMAVLIAGLLSAVALWAPGAVAGWRAPAAEGLSSGPTSGAHRWFAEDCTRCHTTVVKGVPAAPCLECHADITPHADRPRLLKRCATCHEEHNGSEIFTVAHDAFCRSCHADEPDLEPATDFGRRHPAFRPTVVVDPATGATERMALADGPQQVSNLWFPHRWHLVAGGVRAPEGRERLFCESCHEPDPYGPGMRPLEMERHCERCHQLVPEVWSPERRVPHAEAALVAMVLDDFYRASLLDGTGHIPDPPGVGRRRPGDPAAASVSAAPRQWVAERIDATRGLPYGKSLCGSCHVLEPVDAHRMEARWAIAPVALPEKWLRTADFDHRPHANTACLDCHAAKDSLRSADVLLPDIDTCRTCHAGDGAHDRVPSTCASCHRFHFGELSWSH